MTNKKKYQKKYYKDNYEKLRKYKTEWARKWRLQKGMKPQENVLPLINKKVKDSRCNIQGCDNLVTSRGYCHNHYVRFHATKKFKKLTVRVRKQNEHKVEDPQSYASYLRRAGIKINKDLYASE